MVTERLYYTDPYCVRFEATVLRLERHEQRPAAILDRTAFYPSSGGQPFDTGRLGAAQVIDVVDGEDGAILHVLDRELPAGPVSGEIDWARRFEHMQQHTGQHVLSAAFDRLLRARTESFHLGSVSSTIDLSREIAPADIARAENEANRVAWEDREVAIRFAAAEEAAQLPLRKEPARGGTLRLVEVRDYDISACGGTHVARTGAIGMIAVAGWEKFRGGTRIEFLCGGRALAGYRTLRDAVAASVRLVSVLPAELPAGIERVQAEGKELKRRVRDFQTRLAAFEAAGIADRGVSAGPLRIVVEALEGWDPNGLKIVAAAIAERPGHVAILLGTPAPAAVVVARSQGVAVDCAAVLRRLTDAFGGKGGGRPELAQGGGLQGNVNDMLIAARAAIGPGG